ncbi:MAG: hypothetical protein ACD_79C01381G0004 [uncultured bacterium]|nr:MAG: hypothetical protein ACD_79C01381G0004 [uncultured bacterium]
MNKKTSKNKNNICIDVICGGQSAEHDVSILSAISIINGLLELKNANKIFIIYITQKGEWFRTDVPLKQTPDESFIRTLTKKGNYVSPSVDPNNKVYFGKNKTYELPDLYFPVLHGTKGEDGTIQGLFRLMSIPYVGSDVTGGSCGMDKEVMRRIFQSLKLSLLPWISFNKDEWENNQKLCINNILEKLKYPVFVKPANLGSSIGISKAKNHNNLIKAVNLAFIYDYKIVIEQGINAREIECAVLGNLTPQASEPGEIFPGAEFYDYDDKYLSTNSSNKIPADISPSLKKKIQRDAITAFLGVNAKGLSRVDFFICKETSKYYINEINTFPGFTKISMYPKLWNYTGIDFKTLVSKLIQFAFENFKMDVQKKIKN